MLPRTPTRQRGAACREARCPPPRQSPPQPRATTYRDASPR